MKPELAALISSALEQLVLQGTLADMPDAPLQIDHPKDPSHGDLSCNVAMVIAKRAGLSPRDLAQKVIAALPAITSSRAAILRDPGLSTFLSTQSVTLKSSAPYSQHNQLSVTSILDRVEKYRWSLSLLIRQDHSMLVMEGGSHRRLVGAPTGSHRMGSAKRVLLQRCRSTNPESCSVGSGTGHGKVS